MRKGLISMLLFFSVIGAGGWWLQSRHHSTRHHSTAATENSHAASRPDFRAEEPTSKGSSLVGGGPANISRDVAWPEIERTLIKDNAVDANASRRIITADARHFSRTMDTLEATMMADPLAHEFGENYGELLLDRIRMPEGRRGLNLNRIACSRELCFAQMSGTDTAWSDFGRSLTDARVEAFPTHASSLYAYRDSTTGNVDFRFMFTTNPQIKAFRIRPPRK